MSTIDALAAEVCQCCEFGNHTEPCTCDGADCCHPERHERQGPK